MSEPVARPVAGGLVRPGALPSGGELVAEVDRRMGIGDYAGAVGTAFLGVVADLERAYGLRIPPSWTDRDVVVHGLRTDMGQLPDLVLRLYELYEPVRYGPPRDWPHGDPAALLREIYGQTSLRSLTTGTHRLVVTPAPPPAVAARTGA